jgi:2-C-methyl-D-erythritol 4-phosphate cytidylyltransferase
MTLKIGMLLGSKEDGRKTSCTAVVAAAGSSTRMNGQNKLMIEFGGKPVLVHTLEALQASRRIDDIIVVTREEDIQHIAELCQTYGLKKVAKIIAGGATRLESVYNGVMQVSEKTALIAVHDGARPFVTEAVIAQTVDAAQKYAAAAPAVPVTSTVKKAKDGLVEKTLDREELFEIQTPQVFSAELLKAALTNAISKSLYITDDCMAVEALGCPVRLTAGTRENIKLTTATDIIYAEAIFEARRTKQ